MSVEVGPTTAELYPDLVEAGGLPSALQEVLEGFACGLTVDGVGEPLPFAYANIRKASRYSQVMIAAHERAFSFDFWSQGVQYGHGWTRDLTEGARSIVAFLVEQATLATMGARFPWVQPSENAEAHELGPGPFVDHAWASLKHWLWDLEPLDSPIRKILPLVIETERRPQLRCLLPFTSMDNLCFSRTTGFPYTNDCPVAFPVEANRFRVADASGVLGEGDAVRAAELLVANLPPGCVSARHGTADA